MTTFRKNRKFTTEEKEEIIKYVKDYGMQAMRAKFNVWPETVRYWMKPKVEKSNNKVVPTSEQKQRNKEYREYRSREGISQQYWQDWHKSLTAEERQSHSERMKNHRKNNIDRYRKKANENYLKSRDEGRLRDKYNNDPVHKLRCNIREHVRQALKYSNVSKTHSSIKYLGCSIEEFRTHIESQFREGMNWENHSRGEHCWHLDHIKPLATLKDITDEVVLKEICHYTNYQPLWEKENLSKQDKYSE